MNSYHVGGHGHSNGNHTMNLPAFSPKGPNNFMAAAQHVTGHNGFFMNTPSGIGPGDQSGRN
jgi:hypothetical protein